MKKIVLIYITTCLCLNTIAINKANQHPVEYNKPAIDFFEGAVLGNGALGVVVTTRPDAICFHFGHNNVWDIRIAEDNREKIGTFAEVFEKAKALPKDLRSIRDNEEFRNYLNLTASNYSKPYPRPFPCGTVILGFDRRKVELLGHKIDISNGVCEVYVLNEGKKNVLQVFVDTQVDALWFRLLDENQQPQSSCFNRFRIIPDPATPQDIPRYLPIEEKASGLMGFYQVLPYQEPHKYDKEKGHPKDKAFKLEAQLSIPLTDGVHYTNQGLEEPLQPLEKYMEKSNFSFIGIVSLSEGLASDVKKKSQAEVPDLAKYKSALQQTETSWAGYWSKSGVDLSDRELEKIWYHNLYFLNCAVKQGVTCPGIFANWSYGNIGTAWHGDYHLNYNTQQPFWVTFSSNHLDKNLPYVDLVDHLLPISRQWAKEYYNMRGAFFPHSAYPVDMALHPYPVPDWGWEVFETPWTVQGLWWHYIYSMDTDFLKNRAFEPIKDAVMFLVDYMKRPDAHGKQWNDDKYHIFPSVPPELYGLQPGFKYNYDTQIDITMAKFIFKAYLEAVKTLKYDKAEAQLVKDVKIILPSMPEYSTAQSDEYGEIYTSVPGEGDKIVYNVPANLTHVFPGEEYGIDAPADIYKKLVNTFNSHQNEGGNDIVFYHLQAARLGILDLEKFKRYVHYATLPNQTVTDMLLQTGGRYNDQTPFDYMAPMGIWVENFALPTVINECLMQSYNGTINLFPNWDKTKNASFHTLRAVGAFLVSSELSGGKIKSVDILSEQGGNCKIRNPWPDSKIEIIRNGKKAEVIEGNILNFKTGKGEKIQLETHNI